MADRLAIDAAFGARFTCEDCGRERVRIGAVALAPGALCGACIFLPGWYRDPSLRGHVDREHRPALALPPDPQPIARFS